jgi:hypothetical protein
MHAHTRTRTRTRARTRAHTRAQKPLEYLKGYFHWADILRTNQFLGLYYRLLSPLGFRGLEIMRHGFHTGMGNATGETEAAMDFALQRMGVAAYTPLLTHKSRLEEGVLRNLTAKRAAASGGRGAPSIPTKPTDPASADGPTHFLQDRFTNNIPHMRFRSMQDGHNGNVSFLKLMEILQTVANILTDTLNAEDLAKVAPHILAFTQGTSFLEMGMAQILNFGRTLVLLAGSLFQQLGEALMSVMSAYWDVAIGIMELHLYVPFVTPWIEQHVFWGQGSLTTLDLLTLFGSIFATW